MQAPNPAECASPVTTTHDESPWQLVDRSAATAPGDEHAADAQHAKVAEVAEEVKSPVDDSPALCLFPACPGTPWYENEFESAASPASNRSRTPARVSPQPPKASSEAAMTAVCAEREPTESAKHDALCSVVEQATMFYLTAARLAVDRDVSRKWGRQ
jgi:hypothetical protein